MCFVTHCRFIADAAFHHMLVDLALDADEGLAHPAADHGGTAALGRGQGGVGRRIFTQKHRGLRRAGKRGEA